MEKNLIERSKTFEFIDSWFNWCEHYLSDLSASNGKGYGYRAGVFYLNGAHSGQHHDDWPSFFDAMAVQGVPYTSIHALFCYQRYSSCRRQLDGEGYFFP